MVLFSEAMEAEKKKASQTDSVESYAEAMEKIKRISGEEDIDLLVRHFIEVEDRNFALFNYVNEQNNEIELLQEQIQEVSIIQIYIITISLTHYRYHVECNLIMQDLFNSRRSNLKLIISKQLVWN